MSDNKAISYLSQIVRSANSGVPVSKFDCTIKNSIENPDLLELFTLLEDSLLNSGQEKSLKKESSCLNNSVESHHIESILCQLADLQKKLDEMVEQSRFGTHKENAQRIESIGELSSSVSKIISTLCECEKLERTLVESKLKYQLITENISDVIWKIDINTLKCTYISPSIYNLRGVTVEEAMSQSLDRSMLPASALKAKQRFELLFKKIANKETLPNLCDEFQQYRKNGDIIDVEISTSIIYDQNGYPKEILGINRDITERKKAELALKKSEEKYRLITENALDVIWKIDIKTLSFSYVSPSIIKLTGHVPDDFINLHIAEALSDESYENALTLLRRKLDSPLNQKFEVCERFQIYSKLGETLDIEASIIFLHDKDGIPIECLGVSRNIAAQVKMEKALKESQTRLSRLIERQSIRNKQLINQLQYIYNNAKSEIAFFELKDDIIKFSSCNKMWADSIGYKPEELKNLDISKIDNKEASELYRKFILRAVEKGEPIQEYLNWHNRHLHVIVIPIKNEDSDVISTCGSFVYDITERIETELKIQETEERFFTIFNNNKDGIILMNIETETIEVNEGFYQLIGSYQSTRNKTLFNYIPTKYYKSVIENIDRLKNSGLAPTFEIELIKDDGTLIPVEFSNSIITLNQTSMILSFVRDISIRKNMDKMLSQIGIQIENRERRRMAADLHDNVGPLLSSMNMYLSALSRKPGLTPYHETITDIQKILKETISSVREISNNLSPQVLQNYGLTAAIELFFKTKLKIINLNIENNISNLRFEEIKEVMIYNIVKEVFNNSIKYSNATQILLKLDYLNDFIFVEYFDNGIGFDLDEKLNSTSGNLGLFSIINRVKNIEGTYKILTSQGKGFLIKISFPVHILEDNEKN